MLIYNGHEVGEPANVSRDHGRTSFFDFVLMPATRDWLDGTLDRRQQALRRYYARLIALAGTFGIASDPDGLGYYELTQAGEWSAGPTETQRWIHAFARVGENKARALVISNFSDHDQNVDVPLKVKGSDALLRDLAIRDDNTAYTFTEALATEDEDGGPRTLALTVTGAGLHASGRIAITVPRWTASVLLVRP